MMSHKEVSKDWSKGGTHGNPIYIDFPQTKLDSEINAPFQLNEHGDPRFFWQGGGIFAKNSQIKNIFEKGKKFRSRT